MNRTLLCLGLANNKIGDLGANKFADVRIAMHYLPHFLGFYSKEREG